MTLTGAQIDTLLEQAWPDNDDPSILQVSNGFSFTWSASAANGERVDPSTIMLNGQVIDPNGSYRVTVNSFLADGGDSFTVLTEGTDRLGGEVDLDALVTYFEQNSPIAPGLQDRITMVP
jgi:5'-nucleotidase